MKRKLYVIRDRVAEDILTLQCYSVISFNSDQQAARYFADGINDKTSIMAKHPQDYELIRVGTIDSDGVISPEAMQVLTTGDAVLATQQPALVKDA